MGRDPTATPDGLCDSGSGMFPHFTVEQNVALVPHLEQWDEARARARVRELLSLVGMDPEKSLIVTRANCPVGNGNASAWPARWRPILLLLLMDEPFGHSIR